MEWKYETTYIPDHFMYSIFGKHCTNVKGLFLAESAYFHCFPYVYLITEALKFESGISLAQPVDLQLAVGSPFS